MRGSRCESLLRRLRCGGERRVDLLPEGGQLLGHAGAAVGESVAIKELVELLSLCGELRRGCRDGRLVRSDLKDEGHLLFEQSPYRSHLGLQRRGNWQAPDRSVELIPVAEINAKLATGGGVVSRLGDPGELAEIVDEDPRRDDAEASTAILYVLSGLAAVRAAAPVEAATAAQAAQTAIMASKRMC